MHVIIGYPKVQELLYIHVNPSQGRLSANLTSSAQTSTNGDEQK